MRKLHWHFSSDFVNLKQIFTCCGSKSFSWHDLTRFQPHRQKYVLKDREKDDFMIIVRKNGQNLMLWEHLFSFSTGNLFLRPLRRRTLNSHAFYTAMAAQRE